MNRSSTLVKCFILTFFMTVAAAAASFFMMQPLMVRAQASRWVVTSYPDASGRQGMFYTIHDKATNALVVVDGGWTDNAPQVRKVIAGYGNTVDAWILTHYHNDHVDAFNAIYEDPQGIRIRHIYASPMDYDTYLSVAKPWDFPESYEKFLALTKDADNLTYIERDDTVKAAGLSFYFFNTYDDTLLDVVGRSDLPNNGSLIFKAEGEEDSFLFLGDAHDARLGQYLVDTYGEELCATYVQAGHHGNNSMPQSFYRSVDPDCMVFDAPKWLMTSSEYTSKKLAAWCRANGVKTYDYRTGPNRFGLQ